MSDTFFIDAHCHLTDLRVGELAENWIKNALAQGISTMMIGGLDPGDWRRQKVLRALHPQNIVSSFGLHPWRVETLSYSEIESAMNDLAQEVKYADAIGETGLDFHPHRNAERFALQETIFRAQIELAKAHQKPLILHVVRAHPRALSIVKEMEANRVPLLIHSFSGSKEIARDWIKLGAVLSFNGGLLKTGQHERMKEVLLETPLHQMLFETDSPDQAWRADGQNEPCYVREIYEKAAEMLRIPLPELVQKVAENFRNFR